MSDQFPYPFDQQQQVIVGADGRAVATFGPPPNQQWNVTQVSFEMLTAPAGSSATLRKNGALVAPAFSARKTAFGGDPPLLLRGGETAQVVWEDCTPNDIGNVFYIYDKMPY